jgi:hypothetical protein
MIYVLAALLILAAAAAMAVSRPEPRRVPVRSRWWRRGAGRSR